jgi:type IV secretion system protein TrbL
VTGLMFSVKLLVQLSAQLFAVRQGGPESRHPMLRRVRWIRLYAWGGFACLVAYALFANTAHAGAFSLFDPVLNEAANSSRGWFTTIRDLVRPTFLALATLEICWAATIWALEKDTLNSLAAEVVRKIMIHGFFYALLLYAGDWIPAILDTFQVVGEQAGGEAHISTDSIINQGIDVIAKIWALTAASVLPVITFDPEEILGTANPIAYAGLVSATITFIMTIAVTLVLLLTYVLVAAQYLTLKMESYVLFAAGAILLGLGSSSWTKDWTQKYINYALNVGVRLLVLLLVLGLTLHTVNRLAGSPVIVFTVFTFDFKPLLEILAAAMLQAFLALRVPELAGALLNGSPGFTFGSLAQTISQAASFAFFFRNSGGLAAQNSGGSAEGGGRNPLQDAVGAARGQPAPAGQQPDRREASAAVAGLGGSPRGAGANGTSAPRAPPAPARGGP